MKDAKIEELIGQTLVEIEGAEGAEELAFKLADGRKFIMGHIQYGYENVEVEDVCGDLSDLIGYPMLQAEEATSETDPADYEREYEAESLTWTFYKLATAKGSVTIRWIGESNGYYSERVDCAWQSLTTGGKP